MKVSQFSLSLASALALVLSSRPPAAAQNDDKRARPAARPQPVARPGPAARPQRPPRPQRPDRPQRPTPLPGVRPDRPHPLPGPGAGQNRPRPPQVRPPHVRPPHVRPPGHRPNPPGWAGPHRPGWRPPHFRPIPRPPFRYPPGYRYHRWIIGQVLYGVFLAPTYYFDDYNALGLYPPPPGYRWIRYGPDLLLVRIGTRHIYDVIYNAFL